MKSPQEELAAMMAAYAAQSAAMTADFEAELDAPPSAEEEEFAQLRRERVKAQQAEKAAIAEDNAAAIAALSLLCPLTAEQIEILPHHIKELVDSVTPQFGVVLKSYLAHRNANSDRQSRVDWVSVVDASKLTAAMVERAANL